MAEQQGKHKIEGDVELAASCSKRVKEAVPVTDYNNCIICQQVGGTLHKVQATTQGKLLVAMRARLDDVAVRLEHHVKSESWLTNEPKWHPKCRNNYINEKGYLLAERNRLHANKDNLSSTESKACTSEPSSSQPATTRSKLPAFDAKTTCVICGRHWHKSKRPSSKVTTTTAQKSIYEQAENLNRQDILHRLVGPGCDMVANDICYHTPCMNQFRATRIPTGKSRVQQLYDIAFSKLVADVEAPLFQHLQGFLIKRLRDKYRDYLKELGVENADNYRSSTLKDKLIQHYGTRISIMDHSYEAGFICASNVPLGDALKMLSTLQQQSNMDPKEVVLQKAAKILREDAKLCKNEHNNDPTIEISLPAASKIVPDSIFNFTASLFCEKVPPKITTEESVRVDVDQHTKEKALLMSQQMLQQVSGVTTPLGVATAFHIYNQTRSKSLITLNNRLGQGISYDRLQRQLTSHSLATMHQIEEDGVYIPPNMTHQSSNPHLFAMDNLDWKRKTLEGGSFNATTAIIIEPSDDGDLEAAETSVSILRGSTARRTLPSVDEPNLPHCHVSATDRQKSRSLSDIQSIDSLQTIDDGRAQNLLLVWRLCRFIPIDSQLLEVYHAEESIPGFSSFCAQLFPKRPASKIAYLPLIPSSPTNPAVLKEEMTRLVNMSHALGDTWTLITGDQATYELARTVRDENMDLFSNVILLLGGFHLAHNYLMAICKIMRESGAENILIASGLCLEGTTKKMFGYKADYYQSMHAINILSEAVWRLFWKEFESWCADNEFSGTEWTDDVEKLLQILCDHSQSREEQLRLIETAMLNAVQEQITVFRESLRDRPTALFWMNFLDMSDILHKFILHEREGNWLGYLSEAAKMLPYLTAAGHYKYGQQSLPLYLHEMKQLSEIAPEVHQAFMQGAFVGRRTGGYHNGVSPDMLLEQSYNKNAKETSGLDGITTNPAARTKWVYTKSVTADVSSQLKSMLHLDPETEDPHHEGGHARVERDTDEVLKVTAAIETSPFAKNANLINISTGQKADCAVQEQLLHVKQIGTEALSDSIQMKHKKTKTVKLQTFATQNKLAKSGKKSSTSVKSDESTALLRMIQIAASGEKVDIVQYIGNHECTKCPPSIFTEDGHMRSGNKANLVKAIKAETEVSSVPQLPESNLKTSVIVDAMFAIRHWSFHKDETFGEIAQRFKHLLLSDVPSNTESIHFCCDRYRTASLKGTERQKRIKTKSAEPKVYDVQEQIHAPEPLQFFSDSSNKAGLQQFLCDVWSSEETEKTSLGNTKLYLGGGFHEETKTVMINRESVTPIAELESTQEEADTRLILHAIYSVQHDNTERLVIHANDTDVIVLLIYYASSLLRDVSQIWIRTDRETYLPIHDIAAALGPSRSRSLPFIHSLSGRDTTSFFYFTSKKTWLSTSKNLNLSALEEYGEAADSSDIEENVNQQAMHLMLSVYAKRTDVDQTVDVFRAHKFLNNRSTLLKLLPPTESAFKLHVKRAALATMIDKSAHIPKPNLPAFQEFGWTVKDNMFVPVTTSDPVWPDEMVRSISCTCTKGCGIRCSCVKKDVPCYIGCRCTGSQDKCTHARLLAQLDELSSDGSDSSDGEN